MDISKSSITQLAASGHATLQIPTIDIYFGNTPPVKTDIITVPDNYFCMLWGKRGYTPCLGNRKGLLFLTRAGFNYFYEDLKLAYESACAKGLDRLGAGWPGFVQAANDHFAEVDKDLQNIIASNKARILTLQKEIKQYKSFVV